MRNWVLGVVALGLAMDAQAQTQRALPMTGFRDAFIAELKAEKPDVQAIPDAADPARVRILERPGDEPIVVYLDRAYSRYLDAPDQLNAVLRNLAGGAIGLRGNPRAAAGPDRLIAMARPKTYAAGLGKDDMLISRPVAGDLVAVLMMDDAVSLASVNDGELKRLGLSIDEAFALAAKNLPARIGKIDSQKVGDIDLVAAESGLALGLLAAPGFCKANSEDRLYLAADRDYFFSARIDDARASAQFWFAARGIIRDGKSMSSVVIACQAGQWTTPAPPAR